ncbi:MAG: carboxypeptidase-like regulatory domain-containing protein [Gemmataceae bacterium]
MSRIVSLCTLVALVSVGCAERVPLHPLEGTVRYRGKTLPGAVVSFLPGQPVGDGRTVSVVCDADGQYRLGPNQPTGGLPAGTYRVAVTWRELRRDGDEWLRTGRNLLPEKYSRPDSSGLQVSVGPGAKEFAIDLTSP